MQAIQISQAPSIVGTSSWSERIRGEICEVAAHDSNVLITGPTGTGKERIAEAIHAHSARANAPFVTADCAALPPSLFTSQMFGHAKGAFTGADHATLGFFRAADGGTIFLDEIGELDATVQSNLLRVLQTKRVTPVGSHTQIPVDVRIIAATNRNLAAMVSAGQFREDLYYRLHVVVLESMPLKNRPEDIAPLVEHFLARLAVGGRKCPRSVSASVMELLTRHDWPGNVRELENRIERAVVFARGTDLAIEHFPELLERVLSSNGNGAAITGRSEPGGLAPMPGSLPVTAGLSHRSGEPPIDDSLWPTLDQVERLHIEHTLRHAQGNKTRAARLLGIGRHALLNKLARLFGMLYCYLDCCIDCL